MDAIWVPVITSHHIVTTPAPQFFQSTTTCQLYYWSHYRSTHWLSVQKPTSHW